MRSAKPSAVHASSSRPVWKRPAPCAAMRLSGCGGRNWRSTMPSAMSGPPRSARGSTPGAVRLQRRPYRHATVRSRPRTHPALRFLRRRQATALPAGWRRRKVLRLLRPPHPLPPPRPAHPIGRPAAAAQTDRAGTRLPALALRPGGGATRRRRASAPPPKRAAVTTTSASSRPHRPIARPSSGAMPNVPAAASRLPRRCRARPRQRRASVRDAVAVRPGPAPATGCRRRRGHVGAPCRSASRWPRGSAACGRSRRARAA